MNRVEASRVLHGSMRFGEPVDGGWYLDGGEVKRLGWWERHPGARRGAALFGGTLGMAVTGLAAVALMWAWFAM